MTLTSDLFGNTDGRVFNFFLGWSDQQHLKSLYYGTNNNLEGHDIVLSIGDKRVSFRLGSPTLTLLFESIRSTIAGNIPTDITLIVTLSYLQQPDYQGNMGNAMGSPLNPGNDG